MSDLVELMPITRVPAREAWLAVSFAAYIRGGWRLDDAREACLRHAVEWDSAREAGGE